MCARIWVNVCESARMCAQWGFLAGGAAIVGACGCAVRMLAVRQLGSARPGTARLGSAQCFVVGSLQRWGCVSTDRR